MSSSSALRLLPLLIFAAGCDTALPGKGPQTSYCEALCEWAIECSAAERTVDQAALLESCLTDARASDPSCAEAESEEGLDTVTGAALQECTDAIEEASNAGECGPFTGSLDEQVTATTPTECAGQGSDAQDTFDQVQESTNETNDELCDRMSGTFCGQLETCILGALGVSEIPEKLIEAAGGTPADLCVEQLAPITDKCKADELYAPEEDVTDVNTARQTARMCLEDIAEIPCADLLAGNLPKSCAGAFSSTEDALAFGEALLGVAGAFIK